MNKRGLFTNKSKEKAEIFLYDQIGEDFFGGGISAKTFAEELRGLGDVKSIDLRINSPGGDVFDGDAIYNLLVQDKAKINVYVDGLAASAASYIAMAGDTIKIAENAKFMIHNPRAGLMVFDEASVMRAEAEKLAGILDKIRDSMMVVYKKRRKMTSDDLGALLDAETWYVGKEAVDAGFADEVIEAKSIDANFPMLSKFKNVPDSLKEVKQQVAEEQFNQLAAIAAVAADKENYREKFTRLMQSSPYYRDKKFFTN